MITQEYKKNFIYLPAEQKKECFFKACAEGDITLIKYILLESNIQNRFKEYMEGLSHAITNGELETVKYLLNKKFFGKSKDVIILVMSVACEYDQGKIVNYILNSDFKKFLEGYILRDYFNKSCLDNCLNVAQELIRNTNNMEFNIDSAFFNAVSKGHLPIVQYLLTSSDFKKNIDIHSQEDRSLMLACSNGHLHIVEYLLTSPELKEHVNIHMSNDTALLNALRCNHKDIVNFLLTSPKLKEKAILDNSILEIFLREVKDNNHKEMIEYLLYEYCLPLSSKYNKVIKKFPHIEKLIELRDLNKKMKSDLNINNNKNIRVKI